MKIEIDIPEPFIDADNSMINIKGDGFLYTSFDEKRSGLASDKFAETPEEYKKLADALEEISYNIRYLIYHKLI